MQLRYGMFWMERYKQSVGQTSVFELWNMKQTSKLRIDILIYKVCICLFKFLFGSVNNEQGKSVMCIFWVVRIVWIVGFVCVDWKFCHEIVILGGGFGRCDWGGSVDGNSGQDKCFWGLRGKLLLRHNRETCLTLKNDHNYTLGRLQHRCTPFDNRCISKISTYC